MTLTDFNIVNHFETLGDDFFSKSLPIPLKDAKIEVISSEATTLIGMSEEEVASETFLNAITAKEPHPKFCYLSMLYAGHQFGHFVSQLGDGRASLLAQIKNEKGESWDLVLKGSGLTQYSRMGDGKAVLRSSIREFLVSEAMFHLGIPTSRALCLISSKETAERQEIEPAAQIVRMAQSHIRFGSFEVFFYRQEKDKLQRLIDYTITQHFPQFKDDKDKYQLFLCEVVINTAKMIAMWQAFGFCHGVMNTDNMSILGMTFDYGPFGFLDAYDPDHICNASDGNGRYSFANQPKVGLWNLQAFAITLSDVIEMKDQQKILSIYEEVFLGEYQSLMAAKLGFVKPEAKVSKLVNDVLLLMKQYSIDYSFFFRNLSGFSIDGIQQYLDKGDFGLPVDASEDTVKSFKRDLMVWLQQYNQALKQADIKDALRIKIMDKVNPKFMLRNHLLEVAIEKATIKNDFSEMRKLLEIMEHPFEEQKQHDDFSKLPPKWAKSIRISCSS
jgi:uncharacterized protein YdiU (UPF0061 family)